MRRTLAAVTAMVLGIAVAQGGEAPKQRIAVIPKGTTHVFW